MQQNSWAVYCPVISFSRRRKSLQWFIRDMSRVPYCKSLPIRDCVSFFSFFFSINHVRERGIEKRLYMYWRNVHIVAQLTSCKEIRFVAVVGCERIGCGAMWWWCREKSRRGGSTVMRNEIYSEGEMSRYTTPIPPPSFVPSFVNIFSKIYASLS